MQTEDQQSFAANELEGLLFYLTALSQQCSLLLATESTASLLRQANDLCNTFGGSSEHKTPGSPKHKSPRTLPHKLGRVLSAPPSKSPRLVLKKAAQQSDEGDRSLKARHSSSGPGDLIRKKASMNLVTTASLNQLQPEKKGKEYDQPDEVEDAREEEIAHPTTFRRQRNTFSLLPAASLSLDEHEFPETPLTHLGKFAS